MSLNRGGITMFEDLDINYDVIKHVAIMYDIESDNIILGGLPRSEYTGGEAGIDLVVVETDTMREKPETWEDFLEIVYRNKLDVWDFVIDSYTLI